MVKKYLALEDLTAYKIAFDLSDYVWSVVEKWDWFARKTIGSQFVTAVDSNAANIAEGFGRFHKKDKIKFYYYARGSVYESSFWCKKAFSRNLVSDQEFNYIINELRKLPKEINILIKLTNSLSV
ncbi:MAG: hypothetical protein A2373_03035 [Candidatus Magasanikbacteria bacterium RIFOXYB1_FULL_40_15]|uniref:Four helix bundle protein n=1 Tax=Candidatus Magasanikbacteria bacterium RIFOXYB1_FULL_40_15 TaxID=1798697 RepID=A0A1F6NEX8_9BACT|nr:MAG: hypothetical protein A2373_03035 [Candidatus Magasanikbacteria bacterium RIFOXYB1_FULL_40_15]